MVSSESDMVLHTIFSNPIRQSRRHLKRYAFQIIVVVLLSLYITLYFINNFLDDASYLQPLAYHPRSSSKIMNCPAMNMILKAQNDQDGNLVKFYNKENREFLQQTVIKDIQSLENITYDGWHESYQQTKKMRESFVIKHFGSLKSGESLFESACGGGLNLLVTVDILKSQLGIQNLKVYGIDYVESSVQKANEILSNILPQLGSKLGQPICRGDATNLFYIPNESFDFVFTGYIDPIDNQSVQEVEEICQKPNLRMMDQQAQEKWYERWILELIRIAKNGKWIIIEEVSLPLCHPYSDGYGGVTQDWWRENVHRWNIDENSLQFENPWRVHRYNVIMRKKGV